MRLLILTGFLGSGKTTVLLEIARFLARRSQEIVVIENEIGEIGIDGHYLEIQELNVRELFGGCICCTLSVGLIETIDTICLESTPDWIIVEATGAARPSDILGNLHRLTAEFRSVQTVTIVDAGRHRMLMEVMTPLVTCQIESADAIIINKIDQSDPDEVRCISADIQGPDRGGTPVFETSALANDSLGGFLDYLLPTDF